MIEDGQLLRQYVEERSESAFGELVSRHIDMVYSTALRVVNGDRHLAEDVTQGVFIDLAKKANRLPRDVVLAGWLHRHARFTAANAVRSERRRKTREHIAMEVKSLDDPSEASWKELAPHLDECLNQLRASERDPLILKFLNKQDFRAVGNTLGISTDAAQKRVSRALEKLRTALNKKGFRLTATALATLLTAKTTTAAPIGLAASVTAASVEAATGTGTTLAFLKMVTTAKLKTGIASTIIAASIVTPWMVHNKAEARLYDQNARIQRQGDEISKLREENERLSNHITRERNSRAMPDDQLEELLALRGEVSRLRSAIQDLKQSKTEAPKSRSEMLASLERRYSMRVVQLKQLFESNPSAKIPELELLTQNDWLFLVGDQIPDNQQGYRQIMSKARLTAESNFGRQVLKPALKQYAKDHNGQFPMGIEQLKPYFEDPIDEAILERWTVLSANNIAPKLKGYVSEEGWAITQKAPVDAEFDQRYLLGINEVHLFADGPPEFWDDFQ